MEKKAVSASWFSHYPSYIGAVPRNLKGTCIRLQESYFSLFRKESLGFMTGEALALTLEWSEIKVQVLRL